MCQDVPHGGCPPNQPQKGTLKNPIPIERVLQVFAHALCDLGSKWLILHHSFEEGTPPSINALRKGPTYPPLSETTPGVDRKVGEVADPSIGGNASVCLKRAQRGPSKTQTQEVGKGGHSVVCSLRVPFSGCCIYMGKRTGQSSVSS